MNGIAVFSGIVMLCLAEAAAAKGPSFACDTVAAGSIEALICEDQELSALDRTLSGVYTAASERTVDEHPPRLQAEQRGWIKGRNECWKSDDRDECVRQAYLLRIAELQARYRLVPGHGPVRFTCEGDPVAEVIATFFQTDPPTLIAEYGDAFSLMYLQSLERFRPDTYPSRAMEKSGLCV
jgi:uncharacterized protein